jgi:uncharacterized membrane protein
LSLGQDTDPDSTSAISHDIGQATAQLRAEHREETSALQRAVDRVTALVGWPGFIAVVAVVVGLWVAANLLTPALGVRPIDPPPFFWLQGAIASAAFVVAALILTTQRRADELAHHRSQLILELLLLNDQKISKIIELIEEGRRDNPSIQDRVDDQAVAMSTPSDARAVLEAIKDVQDVAD